EKHGNGPVHYAGKVGDAVLEVYPLPDGGEVADTTTRLGFAVGRLGEVVQALRESGAAIAGEPKQTACGLRAVVRGRDGRAVELCQRGAGMGHRSQAVAAGPQGSPWLSRSAKPPAERIR